MALSVLRCVHITHLSKSSMLTSVSDLVVVAVLTVFSTAHELSSPKAIPAFFS